MKAIFEFNLPDENEEYSIYKQTEGLNRAMWEFSQWLRTQVKYGGKYIKTNYETNESKEVSFTDKDLAIIQVVRDKFFELLNEEGVDLY